MNLLDLVQRTARESGLATGQVPSSAVGQVGQQKVIVDSVVTAYQLIQNRHRRWLWLRAEFSAPLTAVAPPTEARYTAAALGIATRFADWARDDLNNPDGSYYPMTIYNTATGRGDEGVIAEIPFTTWRVRYGRGSITAARPTEWAVAPDFRLCLGKPPNDAFTLRGEYQKSAQVLALDADIPEMPADYHMTIVWRAVQLLGEIDEADQVYYDRAENKYNEGIVQLENAQLPQAIIGGEPIA